jgi:hypothetical protein
MNNIYEMAYLNWLSKQYEIKRIGKSIQKTYDLLTFQNKIDSCIVFKSSLESSSIEESIFLDKLTETLNIDVRNYFNYYDTTLSFSYLNSLFKILFINDQDIDCAYREFMSFDPIHEQDVNVHFFVVGKKVIKDRKRSIEFFSSLVLELFDIYLESKNINIIDSPEDLYSGEGVSLRRCIDYFIVIFQILDNILDLKFDEWSIISGALNDAVKIEKLKYVYEFAIKTGTTEEDYCEMVKKTIEDFEYAKPELPPISDDLPLNINDPGFYVPTPEMPELATQKVVEHLKEKMAEENKVIDAEQEKKDENN